MSNHSEARVSKAALTDTHTEHAAAASHDVTRIEVARLDFPILRMQEDCEDVFL